MKGKTKNKFYEGKNIKLKESNKDSKGKSRR